MKNMRLKYLATKIEGHAAQEDRWNGRGEDQTMPGYWPGWLQAWQMIKIKNFPYSLGNNLLNIFCMSGIAWAGKAEMQ